MLRGAGVALAGGATTALVMDRATDSAAAQSDAELVVSGDDVVIRDGTIQSVSLDMTVQWSYAVPSGKQPAEVGLSVLAGQQADGLQQLESATTEEVFLEASGSQTFAVDLLDEGVVSADDLLPATAGETAETTVHVGAEMELQNGSGVLLAADSQTDTATLAVEKSDYDPSEFGTVSGSGNVTIRVE
jgi:hypothetical protein